MRRTSYIILLITLVTFGCAQGYTWKLKETNDYFTFFNKDSDYTQGLELEASNGSEAWAIGQDIYTPVHKRETPPRRDERPYAGYLYLSGRTRFDAARGLSVGLKPGWIGPWAGGKMAQCGIHSLLGQDCPVGWEYQIGNRPTLEGDISKQWQLGNTTYEIKAAAGSPRTYLSSSIKNSWELRPFRFSSECRLQIVGHDAMLEGSSTGIEPRRFQSALQLGLNWRNYTYFLAVRSPAYREQGSSYNYGGIEIEW